MNIRTQKMTILCICLRIVVEKETTWTRCHSSCPVAMTAFFDQVAPASSYLPWVRVLVEYKRHARLGSVTIYSSYFKCPFSQESCLNFDFERLKMIGCAYHQIESAYKEERIYSTSQLFKFEICAIFQ